MESVPTERPTSVLGSVVSLGTLLLFCAVGAMLAPRAEIGILGGAAVFMIYRLAVRELLCRDHRQGVRLSRSGDFRGGLAAFQKSETLWARHPVLDRYRWLLLGSSGPYPFATLARYNQAYCLSRMNRVTEAMKIVQRVLQDDPKMGPALELKAMLENALSGGTGAERTWSDQNPAEATWIFDEPGRKGDD